MLLLATNCYLCAFSKGKISSKIQDYSGFTHEIKSSLGPCLKINNAQLCTLCSKNSFLKPSLGSIYLSAHELLQILGPSHEQKHQAKGPCGFIY